MSSVQTSRRTPTAAVLVAAGVVVLSGAWAVPVALDSVVTVPMHGDPQVGGVDTGSVVAGPKKTELSLLSYTSTSRVVRPAGGRYPPH